SLAMQPVAGLRITLVSPAAFTPYSGMLPGLLAGHYTLEETHIDLARLCQWGGIRFLTDTVTGLDPEKRQLQCDGRGSLTYDMLSIDIGSQPELDSVPGAREHAVPVKPVAGLWSRWTELQEEDSLGGQRIAVVGGGAGSVEVVLAIAHRLRDRGPELCLYCGADEVLPGYPASARRVVEKRLRDYAIGFRCGSRVARVSEGRLEFEDGADASFDTLIWSTGAAAAPWVAQSGLPVDERGFMVVEDTLQSTAYPEIFGAGDIAVQHRHPRPKAGVYAVRQGPVLADNLRALALGRPLREHRPQSRFLSLLSLGDRSAVAERHGFSVSGAWVWRWKDRIDREFMERFSDLPERDMGRRGHGPAVQGASPGQAPCGGCGAKVGAATLRDALRRLRDEFPDHVATPDELDDAAPLAARGAIVQSIDALRAVVDDPWLMGRIAAQHALSDLYATGARPFSALALITLPFSAPELQYRDLLAVLRGALSVFSAERCRLVGGHSMQGPELQLGFAVNGSLDGQPPLTSRGARPGDRLLLSKPLGTGVLFAAHMQTRADGRDIEHALATMAAGNATAARIARECGARALTDVTGFGLAGHLMAMLGEDLSASLDRQALPILPGAEAALEAGLRSTLHASNRAAFVDRVALGRADARTELLFDPQTAGGLLMALPPDNAGAALEALGGTGAGAALIGSVGDAQRDGKAVLLP
ncbi:MAG: selenide, water dikinase SelD, partial [Halieaceae bacterium]|nr:selenide, water dikinase SelD [Halieaceae bacterium]